MADIDTSKPRLNLLRKDLLLPGLLIFSLSLGLYVNTIWNGYVLDDVAVIQKNKITQKGLAGLTEIFTTSYWYGFNHSTDLGYRPLSMAMFAIEFAISPLNTHLNHAVQVLIFAFTCWILFYTLVILLPRKSIFIPFVTTLLFTVHPAHTEVVANLKSRDELLSFLFIMLSVLFIIRYLNTSGKNLMYVSGGMFFLALLSKENSATFLGAAPLFMWFFTDKPRQLIIRVTGFLIGVFVAYIILRMMLLGTLSVRLHIPVMDNSLAGAPDLAMRLSSAISILGRYLLLLVYPYPLSSDYSYMQIPLVGWLHWSVLISLAVHVFLGWYAVKTFLQKNLFSFCILFYIISFALTSNVVFLVGATMAERFLFTPSFGFCLAIAFLGERFSRMGNHAGSFSFKNTFRSNSLLFSVIVLITVLLSVKTISRNFLWKSNYSLFTQDLKTCPNSGKLHYFMGTTLEDMYLHEQELTPLKRIALLADAERYFTKSLSIHPDYSEAYMGLGLSYYYRKDYNRAILNFQKALSLDSSSSAALNNLGNAYSDVGNYDAATQAYIKALRRDPFNPEYYNNLGQVYRKAKAFFNAIKVTEKALELNPEYLVGWSNLGQIYFDDKQYDKAIESFLQALKLSPENSDVLYMISYTYRRKGNREEAIRYLEEAKKYNPRIEEHFQ